MSREVDKIGKLFSKRTDTPTVGVVQSVQGDRMLVRTSGGVRSVARAGIATYKAGDRVTLSGNIITGRIKSVSSSTQVYNV